MQRIGLILPSSNHVVEETLRARAPELSHARQAHIARFSVEKVDLSDNSTGQFRNDPVDRAIDQLREAGAETIVFAGTAGAWLGIEREREWQERAERRSGVGVTSTTLLTVDALRAAGRDNWSLVTPFTREIHDCILVNLRGEGFAFDGGHWFGHDDSRSMATIAPAAIAEKLRTCLATGSDGVLAFCTNFRGGEAFALVDDRPGEAVLLDSVLLTLTATGLLAD